MNSIIYDLLALAIGYLLGSIPFGLLLTRLAGTIDLRSIGSGNIGATNVLRTGRRDLAAATLLLDGLKGTAAALIGASLSPEGGVIAGLAAFIGPVAPVWLQFKGGKGVATFLGVLFGLNWPTALIFCVVWLSAAALSRYSSLGALTASVAAPLALWMFGHSSEAFVVAMMTAIVFYRHRDNIARLRDGSETRIGQKA
ncbi:MAG: glycerol-3-phosphate 1-O-acyltransferase PlsY [Methylocystis sp.]